MCGRYTLRSSGRTVAALFDLADQPDLQARFNIAPTQQIPVVRTNPQSGKRELAFLRWGLVPNWADDMTCGSTPPFKTRTC
jgi:putative SOS response-associated peptidase YedK